MASLDPHRKYEIRCPLHGFVTLDDWEWGIINHEVFQRLRRIRQLAWTDYVYPGAMHSRFEHSLGVMHIATQLYDAVTERSADILKSELSYNDDGLKRDRRLVRLAALLHDIGHGPFSHAAESVFPRREGEEGSAFKHEDYSAASIRKCLNDVIENHSLNANYGIKANDIAAFLEGSTKARQSVFWRELIDGQMDADRMDYLRRDSLHAGVRYGSFDYDRILATIRAIPPRESKRSPSLGISEGGWHAAESLVLARYFMFTQVYFHKTRVAFDIHLEEALKELLPHGTFPPPTTENLSEFLKWDDWRVLGQISEGNAGEHGRRLLERNHYREVYHTSEVPTAIDLDKLTGVKDALGDLLAADFGANKSWYKTGALDIVVQSERDKKDIRPLSDHSSVVANLKPIHQILLYVRPEHAKEAGNRIRQAIGGIGNGN